MKAEAIVALLTISILFSDILPMNMVAAVKPSFLPVKQADGFGAVVSERRFSSFEIKIRGGSSSTDDEQVVTHLIEDETSEVQVEQTVNNETLTAVVIEDDEPFSGDDKTLNSRDTPLPIVDEKRMVIEDEIPKVQQTVEEISMAVVVEDDEPFNDEVAVNSTDTPLNIDEEEPDVQVPKRFNFPLVIPGDGSETDSDGLPGRFLRMQKGNREKALAAFQHTLDWRKEHQVDNILERPHPKYQACKAVFPHYFCGRDLADHIVFVQRPGHINMHLAKANHVSTDELLQHYVYILEYCWNIIEPRTDQTMTSVIDLEGINVKSIMEMISFIKQFVGMMSANYPQRSYKTLLINTPMWFGGIFKLIKPLLRESTKAKIEIYSRGAKQDEALKQYLGDLAPDELLSKKGSTADAVSRNNNDAVGTGPESPLEQELVAFVSMAHVSATSW
jgi:hypothetical protein